MKFYLRWQAAAQGIPRSPKQRVPASRSLVFGEPLTRRSTCSFPDWMKIKKIKSNCAGTTRISHNVPPFIKRDSDQSFSSTTSSNCLVFLFTDTSTMLRRVHSTRLPTNSVLTNIQLLQNSLFITDVFMKENRRTKLLADGWAQHVFTRGFHYEESPTPRIGENVTRASPPSPPPPHFEKIFISMSSYLDVFFWAHFDSVFDV